MFVLNILKFLDYFLLCFEFLFILIGGVGLFFVFFSCVFLFGDLVMEGFGFLVFVFLFDDFSFEMFDVNLVVMDLMFVCGDDIYLFVDLFLECF